MSPKKQLHQQNFYFFLMVSLCTLILACGEVKQTVVSGTVSQSQAAKKGVAITVKDEQGTLLSQDCLTDEKGNYRCLVPRLKTTPVMRLQSGGKAPMDSLIVKQKVPIQQITRHINPITHFIANPKSTPSLIEMRTGFSQQQPISPNLENKVMAYAKQTQKISEGLGVKATAFINSPAFEPRVEGDPNSGSVAADLLEVIAEEKKGRVLYPEVIEVVLHSQATHIAKPVTQIRLAAASLGRSEAKASGVVAEFSQMVVPTINQDTKATFQGVAAAFETMKTHANEESRIQKNNALLRVALSSMEEALVHSLEGNNKEIVGIETTEDAEGAEKLVNLANNMTELLKTPVAKAVEAAANSNLGLNAIHALVSGATINASAVALAVNLTQPEPELDVKTIVESAFEGSEKLLKQQLEQKPHLDSQEEFAEIFANNQGKFQEIHQKEMEQIKKVAKNEGVTLTQLEKIKPPTIKVGRLKPPVPICPFVMESSPIPDKVRAIDCSDETLLQPLISLTAYTQLQSLNLSNVTLGKNKLQQIDLRGLNQLTYLNLAHNDLASIEGLKDLTQLQFLSLSSNKHLKRHLEKQSWNSLNQLKYLDLSNNSLEQMNHLKPLSQLTHLNLAQNDLGQKQIPSLHHFQQLTYLDLGKNHLSNTLDLSHLTKLKELHLNDNQLIGISGLNRLTKLKELNISNNKLRDTLDVSNLTELVYLDLGSYDHNSNQLFHIGTLNLLKKLKVLNLANNPLSNLGDLSKLQNLTQLSLEGISSTHFGGLNQLKNLTQLKELNLSNAELRSNDLANLSKLQNLTQLNLKGNLLTGVAGLSHLTKLTYLNLWGNTLTEVVGLNRLTKLTYLNLEANNTFTNKEIDLNGLTNLTYLNLSYMELNTIRNLSHLMQLTELDLSHNKIENISGLGLSGLTNLTKLFMVAGMKQQNGNQQVTREVDLSHLTKLKELKLAENDLDTIGNLSGLKNLKTLELGYNQILCNRLVNNNPLPASLPLLIRNSGCLHPL